MPKVYFIADGNPEIGLGHISRCATLAEFLSKSFDVFLITTSKEQVINDFAPSFSKIIQIADIHDFNIIAANTNKEDIIVLDGYNFDIIFQRKIKSRGNKLIYIDDLCNGHYIADALINHALGVSEVDYQKEVETKLFLGPKYAIVKDIFTSFKQDSLKMIEGNVCVCFGGADSLNLSLQTLKLLVSIGKVGSITVIIGQANLHYEQLKEFCDKSKVKIELCKGLSSVEMVQKIGSSMFAVVSASTILYEVLSMNKPVIAGWYVDNQRRIYNGFAEVGIIMGLGDISNGIDEERFTLYCNNILKDSKEVSQMLIEQKKYFDGKSSERILKLVKEI